MLNKEEKLFITGASGYLGYALAKKASGLFPTKVLVRKKDAVKFNDNVTVIEGDVLNIESFIDSIADCTILIHAAALVKTWVKDKSLFYKTNVDAVEKLFTASYKIGIKKILHISSFIAIGPSDNLEYCTEMNLHDPSKFNNDYERSKYMGDQKAAELIEHGLPIVRIYPGVIYGPGKITSGNLVANIILDYLNKRIVPIVCPNSMWSYAYIDDVVDGIIAAIEKGKIGERYILGGENRKLGDLYAKISALAPKKRITLKIPAWLGYTMGLLYWVKAELFNKEPLITHQVINIFKHNWAYSSRKAINELNYSITPFEIGIEKTFKWLMEIINKSGDSNGNREEI
jgi:farnesol dehydrogenase